jgi:hypothetical protein
MYVIKAYQTQPTITSEIWKIIFSSPDAKAQRELFPSVSFPPVDLNKNIFKKLQFFDQSEAMEAILDVGKGCRT